MDSQRKSVGKEGKVMQARIDEEIGLLRRYHPDLQHHASSGWVLVPCYPLPPHWNRGVTDVAFQIPAGYPGAPPYGIYVPAGLRYNESKPNSFTEPANIQPPFQGAWAVFSWSPENGQWRPTGKLTSGSNLLNWVQGFADRFKDGI